MRMVSRGIFKTNPISTKDIVLYLYSARIGPSCSLGEASSLCHSVFYINLNSWVSHNAEDLVPKNNQYRSTGVYKMSNPVVRRGVVLVCGLSGYRNFSSHFFKQPEHHLLWASGRYSGRGAYSWRGDTSRVNACSGFETLWWSLGIPGATRSLAV